MSIMDQSTWNSSSLRISIPIWSNAFLNSSGWIMPSSFKSHDLNRFTIFVMLMYRIVLRSRRRALPGGDRPLETCAIRFIEAFASIFLRDIIEPGLACPLAMCTGQARCSPRAARGSN